MPYTLRTIADPPGDPSLDNNPTNLGVRSTPLLNMSMLPAGKPMSKYILMFLILPKKMSVTLNVATLFKTVIGSYFLEPNV